MKILICTSIMAIIVSCNTSAIKSNTIRDFIPGKYVRHVTHEMGEEWDTLSISQASQIGNDYLIQRGLAYERIKDGVKQPIDYKNENRKAIYDEEKMILTETKSGRVISFAPEKNILLSGTRKYKKIK